MNGIEKWPDKHAHLLHQQYAQYYSLETGDILQCGRRFQLAKDIVLHEVPMIILNFK